MLAPNNHKNETENVNMTGFGKGIYLLRFDGKEGRSYRKVVVE